MPAPHLHTIPLFHACAGPARRRVAYSQEGSRGPPDLADDLCVPRPGPRGPDVLVGIVGDDLPGAGGEVDEDRAAVYPPGGHRTGGRCRRDEKHRRADEQNLIPDMVTQRLREIGIPGGKRPRERERPSGADDRARDDQERAFPEDESQYMGALGAERHPDPDLATPTGGRVGSAAAQADSGEHETEQTQTASCLTASGPRAGIARDVRPACERRRS